MKRLTPMRACAMLLLAATACPTFADTEINANRARFNYMLNCQGCHSADGSGIGDIPEMKNFVGNFLRVPGGREFPFKRDRYCWRRWPPCWVSGRSGSA